VRKAILTVGFGHWLMEGTQRGGKNPLWDTSEREGHTPGCFSDSIRYSC